MSYKKNFTILVSQSSARFIQGLEFQGARVQVTPALRELVMGFVRDYQGKKFNLLVFANPSEAFEFYELFKTFDPLKLQFCLCVLAEGASDLHGLFSIPTLLDYRSGQLSPSELLFVLAKAEQFFTSQLSPSGKVIQTRKALDDKEDQEALISIGKSLSLERDPDKLLRSILYMSKKITGADAGSIFLVEEKDGHKIMRFKYSHTFSKDLGYEEFTMPVNEKSIAGYVALTGDTLNIPDVYHLESDLPFTFNASFDQKHGYKTKSILTTPMINQEGRVIGVIQLINSKEAIDKLSHYTGNEAYEIFLADPKDFESLVVPFDTKYEELMKAVAGQAAIAIENNRMFLQIEGQFESFVRASVYAIESRDPATSGHSFRVAHTSDLIARKINDLQDGPFKDVFFTPTELKELNFACLLHDFGKVYIDLELFMKAKKLMPKDLEIVKTRLAVLYQTLELQFARAENKLLTQTPSNEISTITQSIQQLEADKTQSVEQLRTLWDKINQLNEPAVTHANIDEVVLEVMNEAAQFEAWDIDGNRISLLTEAELKNLSTPRGSLNEEERLIIQSHVTHTFNFVRNIPWPEEYRNIPDIASKHHEMLDGSGYPWGLKAENIPLGARIMAVSDVFDALSASDRPYKKAIPLEKVIFILQDEAKRGKLDPDIVSLFVEHQLYELVGQAETMEESKKWIPKNS